MCKSGFAFSGWSGAPTNYWHFFVKLSLLLLTNSTGRWFSVANRWCFSSYGIRQGRTRIVRHDTSFHWRLKWPHLALLGCIDGATASGSWFNSIVLRHVARQTSRFLSPPARHCWTVANVLCWNWNWYICLISPPRSTTHSEWRLNIFGQ